MEQVFEQLAALIQELGKPNNQISPAIYDTAYGLIYQSHGIDQVRATDWLASQQNRDGGWGEPYLPYTRIAYFESVSAQYIACTQHSIDDKYYLGYDSGWFYSLGCPLRRSL